MNTRQKTIVVTGASQGIGAAVANLFLERGYNVVANSRHISRTSDRQRSDRLALVDGDIALATGVYVQAVPPAAVRTQIWEYAGKDVDAIPGVMEVNELVDAALVGFDRRELITIPPLHDTTQWSSFEAARRAMLPNFAQAHPAERYRSAA